MISCLLRSLAATLEEQGIPDNSLSISLPPPIGSPPGQVQPEALGCAGLRVTRRLRQRPRMPAVAHPRGSPAQSCCWLLVSQTAYC